MTAGPVAPAGLAVQVTGTVTAVPPIAIAIAKQFRLLLGALKVGGVVTVDMLTGRGGSGSNTRKAISWLTDPDGIQQPMYQILRADGRNHTKD